MTKMWVWKETGLVALDSSASGLMSHSDASTYACVRPELIVWALGHAMRSRAMQ